MKKQEKKVHKNIKDTRSFPTVLALTFGAIIFLDILTGFGLSSFAATTPTDNPSSSDYKIVVCDGPVLPQNGSVKSDPSYKPCDFNAAIRQVQHLINLAIYMGIIIGMALFAYAGYLYITGTPEHISQAHDIFRKTFIGLIIMLSAWFIVFQILTWLAPNPALKTLLGNP